MIKLNRTCNNKRTDTTDIKVHHCRLPSALTFRFCLILSLLYASRGQALFTFLVLNFALYGYAFCCCWVRGQAAYVCSLISRGKKDINLFALSTLLSFLLSLQIDFLVPVFFSMLIKNLNLFLKKSLQKCNAHKNRMEAAVM